MRTPRPRLRRTTRATGVGRATRPTWVIGIVAALLGAAVWAGAVLATTKDAVFSGTTLAKATSGPLDLRAFNLTMPDPSNDRSHAEVWQAMLKTKSDSDLYVQSNTWTPGASTGWHTHPGWSLIVVTSGTVTAYDGDDPSCTPHVYAAGQSLVDVGSGHVHLIRNESTTDPATAIAVQLIPAGAMRTQKVESPGNCSF